MVRAWADGLLELDRGVDDTERIEQLAALEELKSAAAAAQARIAVDFAESQCRPHEAARSPSAGVGAAVGAQIALARRESPHAGGRLLGMAKALVAEMPCSMAALEAGVISEYRALIMVRETACLSREGRARVDAEVCGDLERLSALGNQRLAAAARKAAYAADPAAVVARASNATRDRRVSIRPAPDTMVWLTALLPVAQGVGCYAALSRAADTHRGEGDPRSRGQVMADTLVERLTGQAEADAVPVVVDLVMTDQALLAGDGEPAHLDGYGPVPAGTARQLVDQAARAWLRRLYTHPDTGQLVATESKARLFPAGLARLIRLRDQTCRTPWCDAPIRHTDHVAEHARGGETSLANGQGLCEACNHIKQALGWRARPSR
jgi:hypothetical protein